MSFRSMSVAPFSVVALCLALAACQDDTPTPAPPRTARVVEVSPAPMVMSAEGSGSIAAQTTTNVGFLVGGRVNARLVDVGDTVTAGEPIASIDPSDLQNQLDSAKGQVAAAQAAVDQAAPEEAAKKKLLADGFTTQAEYNLALRALQNAQADLASAQAQQRLAEDQLGYANLASPVAGAVTRTGADPGQVVQAGQMIIEVADTGALDAVFAVSQNIASLATIGVPVTVWLQSDPNISVVGAVRQIAPEADPTTGTYTIKVGLKDPPAVMRLGALVRGRVQSDGKEVYSVPPTALLQTGEKGEVWVVGSDNAVHKTPVTVERYDTDAVLISEGLKKGDLVVIAGVNSLAEGQVVNVDKVEAK